MELPELLEALEEVEELDEEDELDEDELEEDEDALLAALELEDELEELDVPGLLAAPPQAPSPNTMNTGNASLSDLLIIIGHSPVLIFTRHKRANINRNGQTDVGAIVPTAPSFGNYHTIL